MCYRNRVLQEGASVRRGYMALLALRRLRAFGIQESLFGAIKTIFEDFDHTLALCINHFWGHKQGLKVSAMIRTTSSSVMCTRYLFDWGKTPSQMHLLRFLNSDAAVLLSRLLSVRGFGPPIRSCWQFADENHYRRSDLTDSGSDGGPGRRCPFEDSGLA
jgi:hypothetical protein